MVEATRAAIRILHPGRFSLANRRYGGPTYEQSSDIARGVDASGNKDEGAGDQGIMFGHACCETDALMPAPIHYAHRILKDMADARRAGHRRFGPDLKVRLP